MDIDRIALFINRLSEKTRAGDIDWKLDTTNSFKAELGGYLVSIAEVYSEDEDPEYADPDYYIGVSKSGGAWIDSVNDQEMADVLPGAFKIMQNIYRSARRRAKGFGLVVDDLLKAMDDSAPL